MKNRVLISRLDLNGTGSCCPPSSLATTVLYRLLWINKSIHHDRIALLLFYRYPGHPVLDTRSTRFSAMLCSTRAPACNPHTKQSAWGFRAGEQESLCKNNLCRQVTVSREDRVGRLTCNACMRSHCALVGRWRPNEKGHPTIARQCRRNLHSTVYPVYPVYPVNIL